MERIFLAISDGQHAISIPNFPVGNQYELSPVNIPWIDNRRLINGASLGAKKNKNKTEKVI